jgi:hypothetical protein
MSHSSPLPCLFVVVVVANRIGVVVGGKTVQGTFSSMSRSWLPSSCSSPSKEAIPSLSPSPPGLWVEEEEEEAKSGRTVLAAQEVLAVDSAPAAAAAAPAPAPATQDRTCVASAPRRPAEGAECLVEVSAIGGSAAAATGGCVTEEGVAAIDSVGVGVEVALDDTADLRRLRKGEEEEVVGGGGGEERWVRCKLVMMMGCLGVGVGVAFGAT